MAFTNSWDETAPAGSSALSAGDDSIRQFKLDIRERIAIDHLMTAADGATTGFHKAVHLLDNVSDPAGVAGVGFVYSKTIAGHIELFYVNEAGTVTQITTAGLINTGVPAGTIVLWDGASCPTGYTRVSALDNALLKFGATYAAPSASGATELPAHAHTQDAHGHTQNSHAHDWYGDAAVGSGPGSNHFQEAGGAAVLMGDGVWVQGKVATNQTTVATDQSIGSGTKTVLLACKKN